MWTIWQNLVTTVEQIFVEHLFESPPTRFDVIVVQCDVWVVEVDPVCHAFGHLSPSGFVRPDAFTASIIEGLHSEFFDGFVAHQIESLLNFNFDRKTVRIPTTFSLDKKPFHGLPTANEILVGSSHDVVNARFTVGRWRAFKENEGRPGSV